MNSKQATKLFATHDSCIKNLKPIPLFNFLNNLDTVCIEYFPNGQTLKRTTCKWVYNINTDDGKYAQCNVVNGRVLDQKAYLLSPVQHESTARKAFLDDYEKRISPFKEREARFREIIGPPLTPISVNIRERINVVN
jgi:uncharacterized protein YpiB (UPF0302 family)